MGGAGSANTVDAREIDKIDRELTDIAAESEDENKRLIQIQDRINELEDANARLRRSEEQQIRDDIEKEKERSLNSYACDC